MIDFTRIIKSFERAKSTLPFEVGTIAKNYIKDNFKEQGFVDASVTKWQARKNLSTSDRNFIRKGTGASASFLTKIGIDTAGGGRAILVASGDLRNSIGIGICTFDAIVIHTAGITYGHYHNVGDTRDGVTRQFMPTVERPSHVLNERIALHIRKEVGKFLNS